MRQKHLHSWFLQIPPISNNNKKHLAKKKEKVRQILRAQHCGAYKLDGEVRLKLIFWYKMDKYKSRKKFDLDNMIKFFCDVLTGIIYKDDNQVVKIEAEKKCDNFLEGISIDVIK